MADRFVLLDDQISKTVRRYSDPVAIIRADSAAAVKTAFAQIAHYNARGFHLAGYMAYELGYLLEPRLAPLLPLKTDTPLIHFGVFKDVGHTSPPEFAAPNPAPHITLTPLWSEAQYLSRFTRVQDYIAAGDVYQINLTFPMQGQYNGDALGLYAALRRRQPGHYGGVVSLGGPEVITLSPELFYKKTGADVAMRPMKGTTPRRTDPIEDIAALRAMQMDEKSRAENLMIVDLLRNDLSRIAARGSVKVPELFALESYPTLHQMTSKVTATLKDSIDFETLICSLFPCGSVTGAPKIRAMEIISELETAPRGAYCGAIGYIAPDGESCFNVAIRTMSVAAGRLTYNVGSGVVRDSDGADEYAECLLKANVITDAAPHLIETMRRDADGSVAYFSRHKARLKRGAAALNYPFDGAAFDAALKQVTGEGVLRLRLTLSPHGVFSVTATPLSDLAMPLHVVISKYPLTPTVQETRYKVTVRDFYDGERARVKALTGADEVLFANAQGELCEGSFTSLFIKHGAQYLTPALSAGLLPGILREDMIARGAAVEAQLTLDALDGAEIYLGNALRGLMRAVIITPKAV